MKAKLQAAMKEALKAKDKVRLDTVRGVLSAIQYEAMEKKVDDLSADQSLAVIQREIKKRREEIEFATQARRDDLLEKLQQEIAALEGFLPKQLSAVELEKILVDHKTSTPAATMSSSMKMLKEGYPGQYDGKMASELAKRVFG